MNFKFFLSLIDIFEKKCDFPRTKPRTFVPKRVSLCKLRTKKVTQKINGADSEI